MDRLGIYQNLLECLQNIYESKNSDYGGSVSYSYEKYGDISFLVRITDKFKRIESLTNSEHEIKVVDEKLEDTILDLANYCLLWLTEREHAKHEFEAHMKAVESITSTMGTKHKKEYQ